MVVLKVQSKDLKYDKSDITIMELLDHFRLENKRARLEILTDKHIPLLLPIALSEPDLLQYSPSPFGTETGLKRYVEKAKKEMNNKTRLALAIFDKQNKKIAGSTSYGNISIEDARLEIGWTWIAKEFQGTGLNKNCKYLLLNHAFEILECQRVEFKADARNTQSIKSLESIGAIFEGKLRSHTLMPDGYRRDTVYYSILKKEWISMKDNFLIR